MFIALLVAGLCSGIGTASCTKKATTELPAEPVKAAEQGPSAGEKPAVVPEAPWTFVEVKGKVTAAGKPVQTGSPLGKTDEIVTGPKSEALISVGAGSVVEIREKTHIKLGTSARHKISVELLIGRMWSFFEKETDYEVVTANAVAGVRGTVFFADATDKKKTYFCACKGKTHFLQPGAASAPAVFEKDVDGHDWEHRMVSFIKKGAKVDVREYPPGTPPNHTAKQAEQILKTIHTTQP